MLEDVIALIATLGRSRRGAGQRFPPLSAERVQPMEWTMPEDEPPSGTSSGSPRFLIGKDSRGRWVVQDQRGLRGGLFINRAEAIRFAMFENGHQPQAIVMAPGIIELDMTRRTEAAEQQAQCRAA